MTETKAKAKIKTKTKAKTDPAAKGDDDDSRVDAYLAHLNRVIPKHDLASLHYLAADGYFSKVKFVDGIVALKLDLISKLRRDANARYLYTGPYAGRGAPAATPARSIRPTGTRRCLPSWPPPTRTS